MKMRVRSKKFFEGKEMITMKALIILNIVMMILFLPLLSVAQGMLSTKAGIAKSMYKVN